MKLWAIIRVELWQRRWALLWWTVGVAAFIGLNLAVYPSFKDQAAELDQALASMPESMKALFSDSGDFLSPVGFLSSQIYYLLLPLLLGIFAIGLGASLIAREEQNGTLELVLARPVSRLTLLTGKALYGLLAVSAVSAVAALVAVIGVRLAGVDVSRKGVLLATLACLLMSLVYGAVAFTLSAWGRPARALSIGIAALFALGSYIIASLQSTVQWLAWPAKIFPFHYYQPSDIITGTTNGLPAMIGFLVVIAALFITAAIGFHRRDIG